MERSGPKVVYMGGGSVLEKRVGERGARPVQLEDDDAARIERILGVARASPNLQLWNEMVSAGPRTKLFNLEGVNEKAQVIRNWEVATGRFLSRLDVERGARVAFLGYEAARRLFGAAPAVGRHVHVRDVRFRVVGVAAEKGNDLMNTLNPDDRKVLVPYTSAQRWLVHDDKLREMIYEPISREASWGTPQRVREVTGPHHDFAPELETALWFFNIQESLGLVRGIVLALNGFLAGASLVTLLVGAVGVMNIMLVVVGERRTEIGLRKAVGASDRAIFLEFLAEAVVVSAAAGVVGALLGAAASVGVSWLAPAGSTLAEPPVFQPGAIALLTGALVTSGIVAGVLPALRASRVPPAEALRAL
jgi:putative ABC transport system permease protein